MSLFRACGVAVFLAHACVVCAQEDKLNQLDIDLQILVQGEFRNGGINTNYEEMEDAPEDDYSNFVIQRERLVVSYRRDSLEMIFTPQHQGIWGQSGKGSVGIYEAWAKYTSTAGLFGQIGRQTLSYDDERIIGPDDWAMAGNSHDVLKMGYEGKIHKAHLLLAYNQNSENVNGGTFYANGSQPYKTMHTLWYHYDMPGRKDSQSPFGASLLFMNIGMQGGVDSGEKRTWYQQLVGSYISYTPKFGEFTGCYYRQLGKEEHGMELDAWMAAVKATVTPTEKYKIEGGFDYLSGDPYFAVPGKGMSGLTWHKKMQGFSSVYGSHHKFYGAMDFFYVSTYVNGFSPGLQNAYIGGEITPNDKFSFNSYYHYMATATKLENVDMTLGHAIELGAEYNFNSYISLSCGFSWMVGTSTMEKLKRASSDGSLRWGWLTLEVDPTIFSLKW
jgi:hypothetical protein